MKYYITLQIIRLKRWFKEVGLHPIIGVILASVLFILFSKYLFYKTAFAKFIFPLLALTVLVSLGDKQRNDQLKTIFDKGLRLKIRFFENAIVALPFLVYLLYEQQLIPILGLFIVSIILVFVPAGLNFKKAIATPFKRRPFENIVGFRKYFVLVGILYLLIFKAIQVENYNLAVVAFGSIFFVLMAFYLKPENIYFVWLFKDSAGNFLKRKLIDALICGSILTVPGLIGLGLFFWSTIMVSCIVFVVGLIYLCSMVLAKYSAYPNEINVPQGLLFALSLWFPPMLILVIVIFYKQSKRNLYLILE